MQLSKSRARSGARALDPIFILTPGTPSSTFHSNIISSFLALPPVRPYATAGTAPHRFCPRPVGCGRPPASGLCSGGDDLPLHAMARNLLAAAVALVLWSGLSVALWAA